jgi:hypothetical protein
LAFKILIKYHTFIIMKKVLLVLLVIISIPVISFAQSSTGTMNRVAVGFDLGASTGVHSGNYPLATGFGVKFEFPIGAAPVSIMASGAVNFMLSNYGYKRLNYNYDDDYTSSDANVASFAPVELGVRVYINRFFIEGNAGASFNLNESHRDYTGKNVALVIAPNVGYAFRFKQSKKYGLDISLGYETRLEDYRLNESNFYGNYSQVGVHAVFSMGY